MSENPFGFGGMFDPDDLNNAMRQFAEQAQESQSVAFADNAIHLAVQMTTAAIGQFTPTDHRDLPRVRGAGARGSSGPQIAASRPRARLSRTAWCMIRAAY
jgi:hypothetical protein